MEKWMMVVIGWGIVGPMLAIGACYVISRGMSIERWQPGCTLSGSRHGPHSITGGFSRRPQEPHVRDDVSAQFSRRAVGG